MKKLAFVRENIVTDYSYKFNIQVKGYENLGYVNLIVPVHIDFSKFSNIIKTSLNFSGNQDEFSFPKRRLIISNRNECGEELREGYIARNTSAVSLFQPFQYCDCCYYTCDGIFEFIITKLEVINEVITSAFVSDKGGVMPLQKLGNIERFASLYEVYLDSRSYAHTQTVELLNGMGIDKFDINYINNKLKHIK